MHGFVLFFLGSILASTVHAGVVEYDYDDWNGQSSNGVRGCTGKLLVTPPFKRGDIE